LGRCYPIPRYDYQHQEPQPRRILHLVHLFLFSVPFFTNNQHSGFHQLYSGLVLTIVKGASHMVPQSKRA
jgi:hypothetical protein